MVQCLCSHEVSHKPLRHADARFAAWILLCIGLRTKHSVTLQRPAPQHMYEKLHRLKNVFDVCGPSVQTEVREPRIPVPPLGALSRCCNSLISIFIYSSGVQTVSNWGQIRQFKLNHGPPMGINYFLLFIITFERLKEYD